ncbi:acetyl-CoA synthetase [Amycolatopsis bartoniae]|uniref:AMP-dependent synthetase n=1 Tax=Amycolatopsis bartoniae TaxID=941986 RepID=A0A8H9M846_9PSEU|nr:AMP-binding protein [Amycolatopsis bartoniae]MBB2940020.1 acetyl-CoA synthetase [Amycolatopsis bartoniae]TVT09986.1 AMP-binding protein [Amycolatopsis bartoniae]GHF31956.1 AMP-dependent synthetase [Amycolatopsis bartoniae]
MVGDEFRDHPSGLPGACVAELLCDRHDADSLAFKVITRDCSAFGLTFGRLRERSERLAAGLASLGVGRGDRVATLMSKGVDLVTTQLAIWRLGAVYLPLFTAFGAGAIGDRLRQANAKVVVCDEPERHKLEPGVELGPQPSWTVVNTAEVVGGKDVRFADLIGFPPGAAPVAVGPDGTMMVLYTSGTTGSPKGVAVPVRALASFECYFTYGLGVSGDDIYWNAADPGWAYGLYYAIVAPLLLGRCSMLVAGKFTAEDTWRILSEYGVTNFAAAPTVFRALRASSRLGGGTPALRRVSSAGEPLNPDVVEWSRKVLGAAIHDHYGQTELGMVLGNHHHPSVSGEIRPGSMGRALPGWTTEILLGDRDEVLGAGRLGRLAIDVSASPLMWFEGYLDRPEATAERFSADRRWYLTGDVAQRDEEGFFYFSSRDDDVIIMAGYRIGPFDVESVLISHPVVAEAACVAAADDLRGEVIEAFVVLRAGIEPPGELAGELQDLVRKRYGAHAYPRRVHFVAELPKTPSGKVQRAVLRRRAEAGQRSK